MTLRNVIDDVFSLRQGDVIQVRAKLAMPDSFGGEARVEDVVVVSQTCDLVQHGKDLCTVAPLIPSATEGQLSAARKGQSPLHLYLPPQGGNGAFLADLQRLASVTKSVFEGGLLVYRLSGGDQGEFSRNVASRIGRVFTRFPFPDELYPAFKRLRAKMQKSAGGNGSFGKVLDHVEDLRIEADQWRSPGRSLILRVVVPSALLIEEEDCDPNWVESVKSVIGLKGGEKLAEIKLDRASELLQVNISCLGSEETPSDKTTVFKLWQVWAYRLRLEVLAGDGPEIASFDVQVHSDEDFTYGDWKRSESLDLEVLSDSRLTSGDVESR